MCGKSRNYENLCGTVRESVESCKRRVKPNCTRAANVIEQQWEIGDARCGISQVGRLTAMSVALTRLTRLARSGSVVMAVGAKGACPQDVISRCRSHPAGEPGTGDDSSRLMMASVERCTRSPGRGADDALLLRPTPAYWSPQIATTERCGPITEPGSSSASFR
jgi:hypothetical protein